MNNQILLEETKELLLDEAAIVGGLSEINEIIAQDSIEFKRRTNFLLSK